MRQPRPTTVTFGSELRRYRERIQLTQEKLGKKLGKHPSYISQLEHNSRNPPRKLDFYFQLKDVLKLSPQELDELLTLASPLPAPILERHKEDIVEFSDVLYPMELAFALEKEDFSEKEKELLKEDIRHAVHQVLQLWEERKRRHQKL